MRATSLGILAVLVWLGGGSAAAAACLDLPSRLLLFASKHPTVHVFDLNQRLVGHITLDCTPTAKEWGKIELARKICTDTSIPHPGGSGQCRVIEAAPGGAKNPPKEFELVIRINLPG
jgi:hypothetical protein